MRVTVDKIQDKLKHAFGREEFVGCLRRLPREWLDEIQHVRLMASLRYAETFGIATYSKISKRLVVYSRGRDKREVIEAIVRTLHLSFTRSQMRAKRPSSCCPEAL